MATHAMRAKPNTKLCGCGCGRLTMSGRSSYATYECKEKMKRERRNARRRKGHDHSAPNPYQTIRRRLFTETERVPHKVCQNCFDISDRRNRRYGCIECGKPFAEEELPERRPAVSSNAGMTARFAALYSG